MRFLYTPLSRAATQGGPYASVLAGPQGRGLSPPVYRQQAIPHFCALFANKPFPGDRKGRPYGSV